jgi:cysteine desulfurase/selenocysteine lyase
VLGIPAIAETSKSLHQRVDGTPLIWLDNAATTQKPSPVILAVSRHYEQDNSNVLRGAHELARRATDAYEGTRERVQRFLGAQSPQEIVFVRGATEAINLVAQAYGEKHVGAGDEVVLTTLEHHSNIVPWQFLCKRKGALLRIVPINDRGEILLEDYERLLGPRTKLVALAHVSNALGTVLPVQIMTAMAHRHGARVLVDGAQAIAHLRVDVQALDCDFYAFSGHKIFAPTGIGVLYGKRALLDDMPPWQGGGSMIRDVTFEQTLFAQLPYKFEAGTGDIGGAVGLGAALDYLNRIGMDAVTSHERALTDYATSALAEVPGLRQIGTASNKLGVLSFVLDGFSTEKVGSALDREGIAVRAGHHCAQPALRAFGLEGTVRPSLALYNTRGDVDALVAAIRRIARASA